MAGWPDDGRRPALLVRRDLMILLLAVAAAGVDAAIILAFGVLASAQTGNTILLGVALAHGKLATGLHAAVSIVGYVSGAAMGELIVVGNRDSAGWLSAVGRALVAELVLLGCLFVLWHLAGPTPVEGMIVLLVVLAAVAMGIQSVATLRLGAGATSTYLTGMVTAFTIDVIQRVRPAEIAPSSPQPPDRRSLGAPAGQFPWLALVAAIVFALGAIVGGLLFLRVGETALILPIAAIATVVVAEARRP